MNVSESQSSTSPTTQDVRFYKRIVLGMAGLVAAFGCMALAPYLDDRETVKPREVTERQIAPINGGAQPLSRETAQNALGMAPGSPEFIQAMREDPKGVILALYNANPEGSLDVVLEAVQIFADTGRAAEAAEILAVAEGDHAGDPRLEAVKRQLEGGSSADKPRSTGQIEVPPNADPNLVAKMASNPEQAVRDIYRKNPEDYTVLLNAAQIYASRGKYEEALAMVTLAEKDHPEVPEIDDLRLRIKTAKKGGAFTIQRPDGSSPAETGPMMTEMMAESLGAQTNDSPHDSETGTGAEFLASLRQRMRNEPENFDLAFESGAIYLERRQYAIAKEFLLKAKDLRPLDEETLILLSTVFAVEGKFEIAKDYLETVIAQNPRNGMALSNLAYVYEAGLGDKQAALRTYRRVMADSVDAPAEIRQDAKESIERLNKEAK